MALIPFSEIREVSDITPEQRERIMDFLKGAVYCWCKNRYNDWFSMRDLMGGDNFDWTDTPLQVLFNKHHTKGKSADEAIKDAGKDSGWLLKKVLDLDSRDFEHEKSGLVRHYKWIKA